MFFLLQIPKLLLSMMTVPCQHQQFDIVFVHFLSHLCLHPMILVAANALNIAAHFMQWLAIAVAQMTGRPSAVIRTTATCRLRKSMKE